MSTPKAKWPYPHIVPGMCAHANGQWCKRIRYKLHYFGPVARPADALRRYQEEGPGLHAGQSTPARFPAPPPRQIDSKPASDTHALGGTASTPARSTVADDGSVMAIINLWLAAQRSRAASGEISRATYRDYLMVGQWLGDTLGWENAASGIAPLDWSKARAKLAARYATPGTVAKFVVLSKACFVWAKSMQLIPPPDFGPDWRQPSKRVKRLHRSAQNRRRPRLLSAADIRKLLEHAGAKLRAMILLGINCGFGQTDCATLHVEDLHLPLADEAPPMISTVRSKTGVDRNCVLWPETAAALRAVIGARPSGLVFLTKQKRPFVRIQPNRRATMTPIDSVALEYRKVCRAAGVSDTRFYSLRHTFRTLAEQTKHQRAIDMIMGHVGGDGGADWKPSRISGEYVHSIEIKLLAAVSEHVRGWLGMPDKAATEGTESTETVRVRISR